MHKLFLDNEFFSDSIQIFGDDFKHLKALRLAVNDKIIVCDGKMKDYFCTVKNIWSDSAVLYVNEIRNVQTEPACKIFLFQALPKADKFEFVLQKAVELGVFKIIPFFSKYCEIKNPPGINKLMRWGKISKSAAEQCGRGIIPEIAEAIDFKTAISFSKNMELNFIAHEKSNCPIKNYSFDKDSIGIFIGPEGGFSQDEINLAESANINSVSLGKRIMRTETASLFILSAIAFQSEL